MTDDPDLLTVAGNAATGLFTLSDGTVAERLATVVGGELGPTLLTFTAVRDRIADALGCHLAALRRDLAERIEKQSELLSKRAETP